MLVSTKGRYALRLAIFIARAPQGEVVSLREVSEQESISLKYLEQMARQLTQAGVFVSVRGNRGGYRLAKDASEIRAGDVLRVVENTTAPVACAALEKGIECPREQVCSTAAFWAGLDEVIENYIDGVTLAQLASGDR